MNQPIKKRITIKTILMPTIDQIKSVLLKLTETKQTQVAKKRIEFSLFHEIGKACNF